MRQPCPPRRVPAAGAPAPRRGGRPPPASPAAWPAAQCRAIREYVSRGGSLLATFASSLLDESGRRRENFALADLFGATFTGRVEGPMQNSYLSLDPDATGARHSVLDGLEGTPRIINGV